MGLPARRGARAGLSLGLTCSSVNFDVVWDLLTAELVMLACTVCISSPNGPHAPIVLGGGVCNRLRRQSSPAAPYARDPPLLLGAARHQLMAPGGVSSFLQVARASVRCRVQEPRLRLPVLKSPACSSSTRAFWLSRAALIAMVAVYTADP